ncbi:MAG: holin [Oscillospiraceae bacterium]|nr:holin [Oscillospiraceae bacterium]
MKNWKIWIKAAGIRALKTFAQTMVGVIGGSALISEVNWIAVLSSATLAALMSLLTSIGGLPELEVNS